MHANPRQREYAHRLNKDGTTDSICLYCFATVVHTDSDGLRANEEASHLCLPKREARGSVAFPRKGPAQGDHTRA
jgi:hypothetical protein